MKTRGTEQARLIANFILNGYTIEETKAEFEINQYEYKKYMQIIKMQDKDLYEKITNSIYIACCYIVKQREELEVALKKFNLTKAEFDEGLKSIFAIDKRLYIQTRNYLYMQNR